MGRNDVRKTIYIPGELQRKLEQESVVTGISQTELIRRALAGYLEAPAAGDRAAELAAGYLDKEEDDKKERDRLLRALVGIIDDDDLPDDLARNHDKYLYGGEG